MRAAVRDTFDAPRETLALDTVVKGNYRGYVPLGYFTPNSGKGKGDQYEAWKLHNETDVNDPIRSACHLYGPNVWPRIDTDVRSWFNVRVPKPTVPRHFIERALSRRS